MNINDLDVKEIWEIELGFQNDMEDFISYETIWEFEDYNEAKKEFDSIIFNTPKHNDYACLWQVKLIEGVEIGRDLLEIRKEKEEK